MYDHNAVNSNAQEDTPVNTSANPSMHDLIEKAVERRKFLKTGAGAAALGFFGIPAFTAPGQAQAATAAPSVSLGFTSVPQVGNDTVVVPPGYRVQVLYAWGDPIGAASQPAGQPAWRALL